MNVPVMATACRCSDIRSWKSVTSAAMIIAVECRLVSTQNSSGWNSPEYVWNCPHNFIFYLLFYVASSIVIAYSFDIQGSFSNGESMFLYLKLLLVMIVDLLRASSSNFIAAHSSSMVTMKVNQAVMPQSNPSVPQCSTFFHSFHCSEEVPTLYYRITDSFTILSLCQTLAMLASRGTDLKTK